MIDQIKSCFVKEQVNAGHQKEIGIALGLAVIFMVFSSSFETLVYLINPDTSTTVAEGFYIHLLGAFSAPVFLFCMGIYCRDRTTNDLVRMALMLVVFVLLLELFRTAIPGILECMILKDLEVSVVLYQIFSVDILEFSAISLLVIALFTKLKLKPSVMVIIAFICSIIGLFLQGVSTGCFKGDVIMGYLWNTYSESYFPLLNWLIIPVLGYAFGDLWSRLGNKELFFRLITPICWGLTAVYFLSMAIVGKWFFLSDGNYDGIGTVDALFAIVISFAMIGLGYYISKSAEPVSQVLDSMGVRIISIFCIQWTIFCFLYLILMCMDCYVQLWSLALFSIAVLIASDILSRLYVEYRESR